MIIIIIRQIKRSFCNLRMRGELATIRATAEEDRVKRDGKTERKEQK